MSYRISISTVAVLLLISTCINTRQTAVAAAALWPPAEGNAAAASSSLKQTRKWDRISNFGADKRERPAKNNKNKKQSSSTAKKQKSHAAAAVPISELQSQEDGQDKILTSPSLPGEEEPKEAGAIIKEKIDYYPASFEGTTSTTTTASVTKNHGRKFVFSWSGLGLALQKLFRRHGHSLTVWSIKGLQIGLGLYLFNQVVSALETILMEEDFLGDSELFVKRADLLKLVYPSSTTSPPPPQRAMDLATKLVVSGLPLTSETENSVEKVLKSLTKTEANMLLQILYTPQQPTSTKTEDIMESWNEISGHVHVKEALLDILTLFSSSSSPAKKEAPGGPYFSNNKLLSPPKGILLYGPPGCGKSMLLSALAKTARGVPARTLVVSPSTLLKKYVGESNSSVRTLFALAKKLSPCILVVEELDGLFRERSIDEHEVLREIKTEFLQLWDGILSQDSNTVLVVGATNRPFEIDSAALRRMPLMYLVGLPCVHVRYDLIHKLLKGIPISSDIVEEEIANLTEGYSGSDLHQVLKSAVTLGPFRDLRKFGHATTNDELRPLQRSDVMQALQQIRPTPMSLQYRQALSQFASSQKGPSVPLEETTSGPTFYNMGTLYAPHDFASSFMAPRLNDDEDLSDADGTFWNTNNENGYEQTYDEEYDDENDDDSSTDGGTSGFE